MHIYKKKLNTCIEITFLWVGVFVVEIELSSFCIINDLLQKKKKKIEIKNYN